MSEPAKTPAPPDPHTAAARQPFFSQLRVRLLTLVLLAVLPALGLVLYSAVDQRRMAKDEAISTAKRIVRTAAATQKQHIDASKQLVTTLSLLRDLRTNRLDEAEALFGSILSIHTIYANIGFIDADGYIAASAVPVTNRVFLGDRTYFLGAKTSRDPRKPVVGDYQVGRITGKATINIATPVVGRISGGIHSNQIKRQPLIWLSFFIIILSQ